MNTLLSYIRRHHVTASTIAARAASGSVTIAASMVGGSSGTSVTCVDSWDTTLATVNGTCD